jgi:hypothetical protein
MPPPWWAVRASRTSPVPTANVTTPTAHAVQAISLVPLKPMPD